MDEFDEDIEKARQKAQAKEKKRRDKEILDSKSVLSKPEGRRFVWRILSEAGVFRSVFDANEKVMSFNEGKRDIGLMLLNEILQTSITSFTQMQREAVSDAKAEQNEEAKEK